MCIHTVVPGVQIPFAFDSENIYIAQLMLFNWVLMIGLYLLQINVALASQFGQATTKQIWLALAPISPILNCLSLCRLMPSLRL